MALSRFWLLNGSKKKGKKSSKKISKKIKSLVKKSTRKVAKTTTKKSLSISRKPMISRVRPIKKISLARKPFVYEPEIVTSIPTIKKARKINKFTGAKKMARRIRKAKKSVKRNKLGIILAKNYKNTKKVHRISARYDRFGTLRTSRKSRITRKSFKLNPISAKGLVRELKPIAILGATGIATIFGINKVMPKIPYIKNLSGIPQAVATVGLGVVASMIVKKFLKNQPLSNGVLLGSMLGAVAGYINLNTGEPVKAISDVTTAGLKVLGNPLSFGRPKTALATPNFSMNGLKVKNVNGIKFAPKQETVSGLCERY